MSTTMINWGDRASAGGGSANATVITGALDAVAEPDNVEVVVGGFFWNPALFTAPTVVFRFYGVVVDPNLTSATAELRLYDRGAPGTPIAGTLIATGVLTAANVPSVDGAGVVLAGGVRMYELRLVRVGGDGAASAIVRWGGVEVS